MRDIRQSSENWPVSPIVVGDDLEAVTKAVELTRKNDLYVEGENAPGCLKQPGAS